MAALTFPLPLSDFWEAFDFMDGGTEIELIHSRRHSQDGAGNTFSAFMAQPKWRGSFQVLPVRNSDAGAIEAVFKALQARDGTFLAYDRRRAYPKRDLGGVKLGSAAPKVKSVGTNNRSIALKGLPDSYDLRMGDRLTVVDADKYFMAELMENVSANLSGETGEFEILPFIPPWVTANDNVLLIKPRAKFKIVAGSYRPATSTGGVTSGIGFDMISTR